MLVLRLLDVKVKVVNKKKQLDQEYFDIFFGNARFEKYISEKEEEWNTTKEIPVDDPKK